MTLEQQQCDLISKLLQRVLRDYAGGFGLEIQAGKVAPSRTRYVVTETHEHKTLKLGDVVVMVEAPDMNNWLLRESDMTVHRLVGSGDQYIHLLSISDSNADISDRR